MDQPPKPELNDQTPKAESDSRIEETFIKAKLNNLLKETRTKIQEVDIR